VEGCQNSLWPMPAAMQTLQVKNTFLQVAADDFTESLWRRQMSDPIKIYSATYRDNLEVPKNEKDDVIMKDLHEDQSEQKKQDIGLPACVSIKNTFLDIDENQEDYLQLSAWRRSMTDPEKISVTRQCMEKNVGFEGDTAESASSEGSHTEIPPMNSFRRQMSTPVKVTYASRLPDFIKGKSVEGFSIAKNVAKIFTVQNVPKQYTEKLVAQELADSGFHHLRDYSFLYVPQDVCYKGVGFLFIGFEKPAVANAFEAAYQGWHLRLAPSGKALEVTSCTAEDVQHAALMSSCSFMVKENVGQMRAQQPRFCQFCGNTLGNRNSLRPFRFCPNCGAEVQPLMRMAPAKIA